jgi:hypothetical protein
VVARCGAVQRVVACLQTRDNPTRADSARLARTSRESRQGSGSFSRPSAPRSAASVLFACCRRKPALHSRCGCRLRRSRRAGDGSMATLFWPDASRARGFSRSRRIRRGITCTSSGFTPSPTSMTSFARGFTRRIRLASSDIIEQQHRSPDRDQQACVVWSMSEPSCALTDSADLGTDKRLPTADLPYTDERVESQAEKQQRATARQHPRLKETATRWPPKWNPNSRCGWCWSIRLQGSMLASSGDAAGCETLFVQQSRHGDLWFDFPVGDMTGPSRRRDTEERE